MPATRASATFLNFRLDESREGRQEDGRCDQHYCKQAAGEAVWDQLPGDADNHPPVQYNMEHEQSKENQADDVMDRSPVMAIEAPEQQVHVSGVHLPSLIARDQHVLHQQADPHDGGNAEKQKRINDQVDLGFVHDYLVRSQTMLKTSPSNSVLTSCPEWWKMASIGLLTGRTLA